MMTRYALCLASIFAALVVAACQITEAPDTPPPASTPPFAGGTGTPPTSPPTTAITPPSTTCTSTDTLRCNGDTVQLCNLSTHQWQDLQSCAAINEHCATSPSDCAGFVNTACCITGQPTTAPPPPPPPAGACTPVGSFRCQSNILQICNARDLWQDEQDCPSIGEHCSTAP